MTAFPKNRNSAEILDNFFCVFRQRLYVKSDDFTDFFQTFEREYRSARVARAATTPHLDVLRVFGLEFAEVRHSAVLAWFLNPKAEHEQGALFANALLTHPRVGLVPTTRENFKVERERYARVDVSVCSSGDFAIFVENKVRHIERPNQVKDMTISLGRVSNTLSIPLARRVAIFLTDSGVAPITDPPEDTPDFRRKHLHSFARVEIFERFRDALATVPLHSPMLSNFLDCYLNTIRRIRAEI